VRRVRVASLSRSMGIHAQVYLGMPQPCISSDNQSGNSGSGIHPGKRRSLNSSGQLFPMSGTSPLYSATCLF
jgi:hypothetical protein